VVSKPSSALTEIPNSLSTTMHANNTLFVKSTAKSKAKLSFQNADEVWLAKGKVRSAKPVTFTDEAAETATDVISPAKLDTLVDFDTTSATDLYISGQVSDLDSHSLTDLLEGIDGKVVDRTFSIDEGTKLTAPGGNHLIDDPLDIVDAPKALNDAQAIQEQEQALFRTADFDEVDDLDNSPVLAHTDQLDDGVDLLDEPVGDLYRVGEISGDDTEIELMPKQVLDDAEEAAEEAAKDAAKAAEEAAYRALAEPVENQYKKILADALEAKPSKWNPIERQRAKAQAAIAKKYLDSLPDYNDLDAGAREEARKAFKAAYKSEAKYQSALDEVRRIQAREPTLADIPPEDLLNVLRYTQPDGVGSFKHLNPALRNKDLAKLARLDPYFRLASTGLSYFPEYRGVAYRGLGGDFPDAVLKNYVPGNVINEAAFTSASKSSKVAANFTDGDRGKAFIVIQSKTSREIRAISQFDREEEVLFRPNTVFRVVDRREATEAELNALSAGGLAQFTKNMPLIFLEELPRHV
jgi:hypothetical protein